LLLSRFKGVTVDGVWIGEWTCTYHSELQVITALLLISTFYKSPQHSLSLFQPAVSKPVLAWQLLLTAEILQLPALRASCHSRPYRTLVN
jgi:hypothetical protein